MHPPEEFGLAAEDEELTPAFSLLLRSWIALVLLVLCISLLQYLLMKLHG